MAQLNTRIITRNDSTTNWLTNSDQVLLKGEVGIEFLDNGKVKMKVGDGTSDYQTLKFVSGLAADVYGWAKAEKKPTYEASEITGISSYIADYVETEMGISVDTDTQYQIVKGSDDYTYKLQSKGKGDAAWADVSTITIPEYDDSEVTKAIDDLEGLVGTTAVATQIANAIAALDLANTYAAKTHTHAIADVTDLQTTLDSKAAAADVYTKTETDAIVDGLDVVYENQKVVLKDKDGAEISSFDASAFVKDGMLENVELDDNNDLIFTFNTDSGKQTITIPLDEFIDVYTAGTGIDITGNVVSLTSATQTSLGKADTAVQTVTAGTGLTATKTGTDIAIGIDEDVTFIFDCGNATF